MSSLAVITTFPPNRWTAYAKRMIESHVQYWPDDVTLYAYHEGNEPEFNHSKVKFINIEKENPELVKFKQRHKDDPVAMEFKRAQEDVGMYAKKRYNEALGKGIAKEQARALLPEGLTETTLIMSGTLRSWIHYCQLRKGNGTQKEHREIAQRCWDILGGHFPDVKLALES